MSANILIQQFLSMFFANTVMDSDLTFQVGEQAFQGVVGIGKSAFRVVVESPQQWHITLYTQVCAA